ncbi:hypothetical protein ACQ4PT_010273 [Festuca glaucescens]
MAATAKGVHAAHVPDEVRSWWDTSSNSLTVYEGEEGEEPEVEVDSDSDFERVAAEEENAGVAASESDGKIVAAANARVEEQISGGAAAACHGDEEEVYGDCYVQQGGLLGRKRKAIDKPRTTGAESQDAKCHGIKMYWLPLVAIGEHISEDDHAHAGGGLQLRMREATPSKPQMATGQDKSECLRAENEMLRQELECKTKELQAEQIRGLKLELKLKNKELESVKKQIGELRAENEHYSKTELVSKDSE